MKEVKRFIDFWAASWWRVLLLYGINIASLRLLFLLEQRFTMLTGLPVFDTQNDLTIAVMREQVAVYQGEARAAYIAFAAFDFLFPLIASVAMAAAVTWLLRHNPTLLAARLLTWNAPLFLLAPCLFDWLENMSLLAVVGAGSGAPEALLGAALLFKLWKLIALALSTAALVLAVVATVVAHLVRQGRRLPSANTE